MNDDIEIIDVTEQVMKKMGQKPKGLTYAVAAFDTTEGQGFICDRMPWPHWSDDRETPIQCAAELTSKNEEEKARIIKLLSENDKIRMGNIIMEVIMVDRELPTSGMEGLRKSIPPDLYSTHHPYQCFYGAIAKYFINGACYFCTPEDSRPSTSYISRTGCRMDSYGTCWGDCQRRCRESECPFI